MPLQQELNSRALELTIQPARPVRLRAWALGLALSMPVFFALYWLTVPTGHSVHVIIAHAAVLLAFAIAAERLRRAKIVFSADGIRNSTWLSTRFTPVSELASILVLTLADGQTLHQFAQYFFLDRSGRTRLRLRGQFWSKADLSRAAAFYDLPVSLIPSTISGKEARATYRTQLQWFERRPVLTVAALVAAFVAGAGPLFLIVMAAF